MISLRPQELPRLRDEQIAFLRTDWGRLLREWDIEQGRLPQQSVADSVRRTAWALRESDLFFVGAEMAELVSAAAESLPEFTLDGDDPPSKAGLLWFETPVLDDDGDGLPVLACAFGWDVYGSGVRVTTYLHRDMVPERFRETVLSKLPSVVFPFGTWQSHFADGVPVPVPIGTHAGRQLLASVKTTWLLMRQPLAAQTLVLPDRAAKRRAAREGHAEPPPVRVIALRRPSGGSGHGEGRTWHHRWITRGHWRNQWYPSREVHRPVWIAPFLKGPEGAPLLGGEKVYAWTR